MSQKTIVNGRNIDKTKKKKNCCQHKLILKNDLLNSNSKGPFTSPYKTL